MIRANTLRRRSCQTVYMDHLLPPCGLDDRLLTLYMLRGLAWRMVRQRLEEQLDLAAARCYPYGDDP